jgi:hypothetical protein
MIRSLALAAALSLLAVPLAAHAQDSVDPALADFQKICWSSAGDYLGAVKTAAADDWADADVVADDDPQVSLTDKTAKSKSVGDNQLSVLITRGLRKMKDGSQLKVETCKISSSKPDGALVSEAKTWIGAPPDSAPDPTLAVYFVKPGAGAPDHVGQAGSNAALAAGGLGILKFQQERDGSILVYQVYSK